LLNGYEIIPSFVRRGFRGGREFVTISVFTFTLPLLNPPLTKGRTL